MKEPGSSRRSGFPRLGLKSPWKTRRSPPATRFVILASARTGSNLLQGMLDSHEQVSCFGELFNDSNPSHIQWNTSREIRAEDIALRDADPCGFLEQRVFAVPPHVRAVGFKLFYFHAVQGPWSAIWPYLRGMSGLRVLHLRRTNLLRKLVSERLAARTGKWWINRDEDAYCDVSIELGYDECMGEFDSARNYERDGLQRLAGQAVLDLTYERLAAAPEIEANRALEFLGVAPQILQARIKRQLRDPLTKVVSNYSELAARFAGTADAAFFDEPVAPPMPGAVLPQKPSQSCQSP